MSTKSILISTIQDDLHAYVVADRLRKRFGCRAFIQEVDRLYRTRRITIDFNKSEASVDTLNGSLDISDVNLIWWRRSRADQSNISNEIDEKIADLINQDSRASWRGALSVSFRGKWVSEPEATERASFKAHQLRRAADTGLRIPATIITNDPTEIRRFAGHFSGGFIIKPVAGSRHLLTENCRIIADELPHDDVLAACPAIYQEFIIGASHLRVNVFGSEIFAFEITSQRDDWRQQLPTQIKYVSLPASLERILINYVESLGLRMGILDLKRTPDGDTVFFEINPQGQFLFLEGITKFPLADRFSEFLCQEAA